MATSIPTTAARLVNLALTQEGIKEYPADSNRQRYGAEFGENGVPWCAIFVWWVFHHAAGYDLRSIAPSVANARAFEVAVARAGWERIISSKAEPGDIVFFTWEHVGIVEKNVGDALWTIEGNTGLTGVQNNGGEVMRRLRARSLVRSVYRPPYAKQTPQSKMGAVVAVGVVTVATALATTVGNHVVRPAPVPVRVVATTKPSTSPTAIPGNHSTPTPKPTPTPKHKAAVPAAARLLRLGSRGADVAQVQAKLKTSTDGIFGRRTDRLVRSFQTAHKLEVDGIVGPHTRKALGL